MSGVLPDAGTVLPAALVTVFVSVLAWIWLKTSRTAITRGDGKYVLITGCDSGFGREIAIRLDRLGFSVFAACLSREGERSLSTTCSERLTALHLDVTKEEDIENTRKRVTQLLPSWRGRWDIHTHEPWQRYPFTPTFKKYILPTFHREKYK